MIATPRHPNGLVTGHVVKSGAPGCSSGTAGGTVLAVAAVYAVWVLATYLLEGSRQALLRPEAQADRLVYAVVANLLAGTLLPLWTLRTLMAQRGATPRLARFCTAPCTAISVVAAGVLGLFMLLPLWQAAQTSAVRANVFAMVLPTSIAEVIVCWVLAGAAVDAVLTGRGRFAVVPAKWVCGAGLFGLYHLAHSPPYDTWPMVLFLSGVGLVTGAFFLISEEVYGTILLHGSLATSGLAGSLAETGNLSSFESAQPVLYIAAAASIAVLIASDPIWFRERQEQPTPVWIASPPK